MPSLEGVSVSTDLRPVAAVVLIAGPDEELIDATLAAIGARAPELVERLRISVIRSSSADEDAAGTVSVELPAIPVIPRGRLQVRLNRDGQPAGTALINVAHFDSVGVVTAALDSGAELDGSSLRFVWMETTRFSGQPLTPDVLRKWSGEPIVARRSLRVDRPIRVTDVGPRPAADTGDAIRMVYRRGSFKLELSCRARDRGQVGDIIRVYADDSDTMYRARLTGPGRAEWIETL
ncbi:MAG: flagellar basal body P-ring formation protein FlgA [Rhodothermales bacterium]|nr:flagellar basal body P-ring formation protein FlgA [Rhodothermales bacterium]